MKNKQIVYVDMDGTLCDYASQHKQYSEWFPERDFVQSTIGFFRSMKPIKGAIDGVNALMDDFDVYILSAPSGKNPHSYSEKRVWIGDHFGGEFYEKLILSNYKNLNVGDFLIDDFAEGKGQEDFQGELIHFGLSPFEKWEAVVDYLCKRIGK